MKRNTLLYIILGLSALGFLFSSCTKDEERKNDGSDNKIALRLSTPKKIFSRATEDGENDLHENKIATLDVLFYLDGRQECAYYERVVLSPELDGTEEHTVFLDATQNMFSSNLVYDIFVVANYSENIVNGGISRDELKALTESPLDPDQLEDLFLMDALTSSILNDGNSGIKNISVTLKRAAAKIRVSMEFRNSYSLTGQNNNKPLTKKLFNYAVNTNVIESGTPVVPELQSMDSFTPEISGAGSAEHIIVYSYPNDWNNNANNETYLIVNVPISGPGGNFPNNYYRVPVNYRLPQDIDDANLTPEQIEAQKNLYRLQRNYLYDITLIVDKPGATTPENAVELDANYRIEDWTTREVIVEVEGINYLYVRDVNIRMLNTTQYTTIFQSSSPEISVGNIQIDGVSASNGDQGINISWDQNVSSGNLTIESPLLNTFVPREITFTVSNGDGLTQDVTVTQYPDIYLTHDISADEPSGEGDQNNTYLYIITSLTADFSNLPDPDEFDEDFGMGGHDFPDPELGAEYAEYVRTQAILGLPVLDADGATADFEENNRRISPRFMLASQYGTTRDLTYQNARISCMDYVENDETTGQEYSDWRMPTLAEAYLIDILQNIRTSKVKEILEGGHYWSSRSSMNVRFMDPRIKSLHNSPYSAAVRCVRDLIN